jgi:hypothetical protein
LNHDSHAHKNHALRSFQDFVAHGAIGAHSKPFLDATCARGRSVGAAKAVMHFDAFHHLDMARAFPLEIL